MKSLIDRIQELLVINRAQVEKIKELEREIEWLVMQDHLTEKAGARREEGSEPPKD